MSTLSILLYAAGAFAVLLGILHFTFPERFGFREALSAEGPPPPVFRVGFYRYPLKRRLHLRWVDS